MNISDYLIKPDSDFKLGSVDPDDKCGLSDKDEGAHLLDQQKKRIEDLQERLFAEGKQSLLVVFQATDTGGKDGVIRSVFSGVNPAGVRVTSFKVPTDLEARHDFLWRYHLAAPEDGMIGVFNRSQYEEVLVVRVRKLVEEAKWKERYDLINHFEKQLAQHGTRIVKFYLHISREEQQERLQARLDDPAKHWKFNVGDLDDRALWDDYQAAFEDAIRKCSTDYAPWYVIPSNRKWVRNALVSSVIAKTLEDMNPRFPENTQDLSHIVIPN